MSKSKDGGRRYFIVSVVAWGEAMIYDTEERAERWRRDKARWECSIARKREVTEGEADQWLRDSPYQHVIDGDGSKVTLAAREE
jgi:hypothetical protein